MNDKISRKYATMSFTVSAPKNQNKDKVRATVKKSGGDMRSKGKK